MFVGDDDGVDRSVRTVGQWARQDGVPEIEHEAVPVPLHDFAWA
jgi:hypothetical protein